MLTSITPPLSRGLVAGYSVAFRTGAELYSDAIIKSDVALHVSVGDDAKEPYARSVSTQISRLRHLLLHPVDGSPFKEVVEGKLPLVINVNEPNDISKIIGLLRSNTSLSNIRPLLAGAVGAWKVAKEVRESGFPILLQPARCVPGTWETRDCRLPFSRPTTTEMLIGSSEIGKESGIVMAISVTEPDQVRSLRFEAGWLAAEAVTSGVSIEYAVGAVTWHVADSFGLGSTGIGRVLVGTRANMVGLNGEPLALQTEIQIIGDGANVVLHPKQD